MRLGTRALVHLSQGSTTSTYKTYHRGDQETLDVGLALRATRVNNMVKAKEKSSGVGEIDNLSRLGQAEETYRIT